MRTPIRRRLSYAAATLTVLGLVLTAGAANAANPTAASLIPDQPISLPLELTPSINGQPIAPLTLITGDQLLVRLDPAGQPQVHRIIQAPRDDRATVPFYTITQRGQSYVVPDDALPLLRSDVLDWELFNPAKLIAHVLNGTVDEVPVLVSHAGRANAAPATAGATVTNYLPSVNATAMTIEGDGQWWQQVRAGTTVRAARTGALAGVEKIWLNELARIQLEDSVPQIGAEVAWELDYDGSGVTVAVLDTGIDANHPDVAGKVIGAVDFTDSPTGAADGHGHGTHVAATIAGSGDASAGLRPGVAPGASILVGKVCNDGGSCPNDAIIAGMEWAAQSGAQVVNMSLGGGPTDGTDILSQAVNALSLEHGTLFVIAAGNSGPGASTVAAPSVADEALSVAAVDKSDEMADFSSRGPRVGDGALKPEIAAPGVGIIAARAAGTAMGTPVGDHYTTASGTSMATPHVAGAAAIVAQQHPDLSGRQIKALLMNTALDLGHDVNAQGVGRVDLSRAVDPSVFSDGNVGFGRQTYPHAPVTRTITYTNLTEEPITLSLAAEFESRTGVPAPAGLLTLGADQVTVPADGTATVDVTLDGRVLGDDDVFGTYAGRVNAVDSEGTLRASSSVLALLEPQRHQVTVEIVPPAGAESLGYQNLLVAPVGQEVALHGAGVIQEPGAQTVELALFPDTYAVMTSVSWRDTGGVEHLAIPAALEVSVTGPTTVTLDLRQAQPVRVQTPKVTETFAAEVVLQRIAASQAWGLEATLSAGYGAADPNWWLLPSQPVTVGTVNYSGNFTLVPSPVTLRAVGGGPSLNLAPRYATPEISVPGPEGQWVDDEGNTWYEPGATLPVPKLVSNRPLLVVDGGTGSAADLAAAQVAGAVVLIQPTDICSTVCPFDALRTRLVAAAEAGATAVVVSAADGTLTLPLPPTSVPCPDGPDSCPGGEDFAVALPVLTLPAAQAEALRQRLAGPAPVRVHVGGDPDLSQIHALRFAETGAVPALPHQIGSGDLQRVTHHLHSSAPGEVTVFSWGRALLDAEGSEVGSQLPRVASQRTVEVLVGPKAPDVIDMFAVGIAEYAGPYELARPVLPPDAMVTLAPSEQHYLVLEDRNEIRWNVGPQVPGAGYVVTSPGGTELRTTQICSGCREGDHFFPYMLRTGSSGYQAGNLGLINDTGLSVFMFLQAPCPESVCQISLLDGSGSELESTLFPVEFRFDVIIGGEQSGTTPEWMPGLRDAPALDGLNLDLSVKEAGR